MTKERGTPNKIQKLNLLLEGFETEGDVQRESNIRVRTLRCSENH